MYIKLPDRTKYGNEYLGKIIGFKLKLEQMDLNDIKNKEEYFYQMLPYAYVLGIFDKWTNKSDFSGDYEDLINKPEIPSIEGLVTEEYVDTELDNKVDKVEGKSLVDNTEIARLSAVESYEVVSVDELLTMCSEIQNS